MTDVARPVTKLQWEALELVVGRADGHAVTYVVAKPEGDAAISRRAAKALFARGFINLTDAGAWPTPGGRRALESHLRLKERKAR